MKKKKNTSKKEKSLAKSAREALRFQMLWEAKKLFPDGGDGLAERIDRECTLAEEGQLLPCFRQGKEFVDDLRAKFGDSLRIEFPPFLQNSILARCIGLTTGPVSLDNDPTVMLTQAMSQDPLAVDVRVDGVDLSAVYKWLMESGKAVRKYSEGMEVLIDALSFRFPAIHCLAAVLMEKAQKHGLVVDEVIYGRLLEEVRIYVGGVELKRLPFLEDFTALADYVLQLNATLQTKIVIKGSSALQSSVLAACCLGTSLPAAKVGEWKGEPMDAEIDGFSRWADYEPAMRLFKARFLERWTNVPNGWMADFGIIRLTLNLAGSFRAAVWEGAARLCGERGTLVERRLTDEMDWYEQSGLAGDMLLLKSFVQEVTAKWGVSICPGTALLGHSVAAFCLGLAPDSPNVEDENDGQFFEQKKHAVREVNVQFSSERSYQDIVDFAADYFGGGKKGDGLSTFSLGKLTLKLYKYTPELPEGVKWYRLGTMQKMFEHYAKYAY